MAHSGYCGQINLEEDEPMDINDSDSEDEDIEMVWLSDDSDAETSFEKEEIEEILPEIQTGATIIIDKQRVHIGKQLGSGVFGRVFHVKDERQSDMAMKVQNFSDSRVSNYVTNELRLLNLIECSGGSKRHIVAFKKVSIYNNDHCLFFELMGRNLEEFIEQYKHPNLMRIEAIQRISYQLLTAIEHIHSIGIVHTDIKPTNILFTNKMKSCMAVKLCDFGNAKTIKQLAQNTEDRSISALMFRAPEIYLGIDLNEKLDIWCLACTLVELYTGFQLFPAYHEQQLNLFHVELLGIPSNAREGNYCEYFKVVNGKLHVFSHNELLTKGWGFTKDDRELPIAYLKDLINLGRNGLKNKLRDLDFHFLDLLAQLLNTNNSKRISATAAKNHQFFQ